MSVGHIAIGFHAYEHIGCEADSVARMSRCAFELFGFVGHEVAYCANHCGETMPSIGFVVVPVAFKAAVGDCIIVVYAAAVEINHHRFGQ